MTKNIFEVLKFKCPNCGNDFSRLRYEPENIVCLRCSFHIRHSDKIWDARVNNDYSLDFSEQWRLWEKKRFGDTTIVYGRTRRDDLVYTLSIIGLSIEDLAKKKILEIGFGHGRLLKDLQNYSSLVFGLDLVKPSPSANLRENSVIRSDLFKIPLMPYQFDLVICRGVIHHTEDAELAFKCVAEQAKQGGMLYLYVYEKNIPKCLSLRKLFPYSWLYPIIMRLFFILFYWEFLDNKATNSRAQVFFSFIFVKFWKSNTYCFRYHLTSMDK